MTICSIQGKNFLAVIGALSVNWGPAVFSLKASCCDDYSMSQHINVYFTFTFYVFECLCVHLTCVPF